MKINNNDTAVAFIDPQYEVLSETRFAWRLVRESVRYIGTIANMERVFKVRNNWIHQARMPSFA
jgi:hypothetical protein